MSWKKPKTIQREEGVESWCRAYAHERGWVSRKMNGLGFRSWPDRLFVPPPKRPEASRFWVEFKRPNKTSTPDQARMQKDLRNRGEVVYVCSNKQRFVEIFDGHHHYG